MSVTEQSREQVKAKLVKQSPLAAAIGVACWSIPIIILWITVFSIKSAIGPVMLVISGVLVGLAVRIHGRGYDRIFSVISLIAYLSVIAVALSSEVLISGTLSLSIYALLFALGSWSAAFIARKSIPFIDHKLFAEVYESGELAGYKKIKNHWLVVLPSTLIATSCLSFAGAVGAFAHQQYLFVEKQMEQEQHQAAKFRAKHIPTDDEFLATLSNKKAFSYAFAYYSGRHFDEQGVYQGNFPQDTFKSETILRYLVEHKNEPRAQFILGRMLAFERGEALMASSRQSGDQFARLYDIYQFGCHIDAKQGRTLLQSFKKLVTEQSVIIDIQQMQSNDFRDYCDILDDTEFDYRYIRDYKS